MTKQAEDIVAKTGVKHQDVKQILQMTLDGISNGIFDVLVSESRLELRDFMVFEVRMRKARKARNPRTGAAVLVQSRPQVTFHAGRRLKKSVSGNGPATESLR